MPRKRILHDLTLDKIAAVDLPAQEHATMAILKRNYTAAQRTEMADRGWAMPDGSHLIADRRDLQGALADIGTHVPDATKAHLAKRAEALGAVDMLPRGWGANEEGSNDMGDDFVSKVQGIMKRDGCSRTQALSRTATEFPDALAAYCKAAEPAVDEPDSAAAARREARLKYHNAARSVAASRGVPRHVAMQQVSRDRPDLHAAAFD